MARSAAAAIVQLIDAVMLRPLPVADAGELTLVQLADLTRWHGRRTSGYPVLSNPLWEELRDTQTTFDEIEIVFGHEIARIVAECSDDKKLTKLQRKQAQIDKAATLSHRAKLVKLADKIANVSDIDGAPPAGWSVERKREYFDWSKQVVDRLRGTHAVLEARFDAEFVKRP
jgi:guanosine-3',5'-bis(diphosphate) 3'-pyrophosphohydrolase